MLLKMNQMYLNLKKEKRNLKDMMNTALYSLKNLTYIYGFQCNTLSN